MTITEAMTADMADDERLRAAWSERPTGLTTCRESHDGDVFFGGHCGVECVSRLVAEGHPDARLLVQGYDSHGVHYRDVGALALQ